MNKAIIALILTAPMFASAASFDCAKAGAPIEKRICNNPALDMMDTIQSNLYKAARAVDPSQQQAQRDWNRNVRVASKTDEELVVLYRARNAELMSVVNGEPVEPEQPVQQTRPAPVDEKPVVVQLPEPAPVTTKKFDYNEWKAQRDSALHNWSMKFANEVMDYKSGFITRDKLDAIMDADMPTFVKEQYRIDLQYVDKKFLDVADQIVKAEICIKMFEQNINFKGIDFWKERVADITKSAKANEWYKSEDMGNAYRMSKETGTARVDTTNEYCIDPVEEKQRNDRF